MFYVNQMGRYSRLSVMMLNIIFILADLVNIENDACWSILLKHSTSYGTKASVLSKKAVRNRSELLAGYSGQQD